MDAAVGIWVRPVKENATNSVLLDLPSPAVVAIASKHVSAFRQALKLLAK